MAMPMPIDIYAIPELDFSGDTTPMTTSEEEDRCSNWNQWSPMVNWEAFAGSDDFMESAMEIITPDPGFEEEEEEEEVNGWWRREGSEGGNSKEVKGLRLVHLLMAAAEAVTGANKSRDLARVILVRLKDLVSPSHGTNMERLAAYFAQALHALLEGAGGGHKQHCTPLPHPHGYNGDDLGVHRSDMLGAFQLLQDMSPYVKFAHFTANQAILEALAHHRRLHIVDYDILEGTQWASFLQALSSRTHAPAPHLRITALSRGGPAGSRRSIATVQETGRRLSDFAASVGQPFSFHHCRLDSDETFRPSALKLVRGDVLVFNCMLHLPHQTHRPAESVRSFLDGARAMSPALLTLAEEEPGPRGDDVGFVGRFMDSLHHYSAVYDSLEAGFPMQGRARAMVERVFLGPRIAGSLGRIYRMGEGATGSWGEWLGEVGCRGVDVTFANHCQAKLLLGLFNDGYRVEELGSNKLVLSWKSRRLLSASLWTFSSPT